MLYGEKQLRVSLHALRYVTLRYLDLTYIELNTSDL
jgi:hypothetical protein